MSHGERSYPKSPHMKIATEPAPALGHHLLNIPVAQAEAAIEPDTMTDNLRREAMAFVELSRRSCRHAVRWPLYRFVVGGSAQGRVCHREQRLYRQAHLFDNAIIAPRHHGGDAVLLMSPSSIADPQL